MLFSVIIPATRRNRPLSHAISSLLLQNYSEWEAIIIGDTLFHDVQTLFPHDPRLRFVSRPTASTHEACAIGIHAARGQVITFLLPDDYFSPAHLSVHRDFLDSHRDLDAVFGKPTVIGSPYREDTLDRMSHRHVHEYPTLGTSFIHEHVFDTLTHLPKGDLRTHLTTHGFRTHTITMPSYVYDRTEE